MKTLENTVWAEEAGVQVTLERENGLIMLLIAEGDQERRVSVTFARWSRLMESAGFEPKLPTERSENWGRGMFIAGAAAGVTRKSKR